MTITIGIICIIPDKKQNPGRAFETEVYFLVYNELRLDGFFQFFAVVLRITFGMPAFAVNFKGVVKQELVIINVFVA